MGRAHGVCVSSDTVFASSSSRWTAMENRRQNSGSLTSETSLLTELASVALVIVAGEMGSGVAGRAPGIGGRFSIVGCVWVCDGCDDILDG